MIYYSFEDEDAPTEAATSPKNVQTLQSTSFRRNWRSELRNRHVGSKAAGESIELSHGVDSQEVQDSDLKELNLLGVEEDELQPLKEPSAEDEAIVLQEWCSDDLVHLPFLPLPSSDGTLVPLPEAEAEELRNHIASGHVTKPNLCRGCLTAEGPRPQVNS